jgi:hypothetical protein
MRSAAAALVAAAVGVLPIVRDRCADECEAHETGPATTPACHHASSTAVHVASVPNPCGHDHHIVVATDERIARIDAGSASGPAIEVAQPLTRSLTADSFFSGSPPTHSGSVARPIQLRV